MLAVVLLLVFVALLVFARPALRVVLFVLGLALIGIALVVAIVLLPARPTDAMCACLAAGCVLALFFAPDAARHPGDF